MIRIRLRIDRDVLFDRRHMARENRRHGFEGHTAVVGDTKEAGHCVPLLVQRIKIAHGEPPSAGRDFAQGPTLFFVSFEGVGDGGQLGLFGRSFNETFEIVCSSHQ